MWVQSKFCLLAITIASLVSTGCNPFASSGTTTRNIAPDPCGGAASLRMSLQESIDPASEDPDAVKAGALAIGQTMVSELCQEIRSEHDSNLAAVIAAGATVELNAAVGSLIIVNDDGTIALRTQINAPTLVTGPIVRGAFLSLTQAQASLNAASQRVELAKDIISGTSSALKKATSEMTTAESLEVIGGMANSAVKTLPDANLAGDNSRESVAAVTMTAVGALPRAGILPGNIGQGAQKLAEGAVSALTAPGFTPSSLGSLTGEIAGSAIQGLGAAGLSAETIIASGAIESVISGAASGLKKNETTSAGAVDAMGSIAGAAVSVLSKVGLTTPEMQKGALAAVVKSSMSGAQSLAGNSNENLAEAMSAVASQAVLALTSGGFETNQISNAISVIVETGVSEISKNGITSASLATEIASGLIEGALTGAGTLIQSGTMNADEATELARSASTGAVEGLQSLQTAGIITGDAVSVFTTSIVDSVSSGLEKGGADADVVAQAQTGATTVMESDAVQEQIQASSGTADPVAAPTFSLAAGTYTSAISVTLSTTTTGATIRYTLDGSTPTASNGAVYAGSITISSSKTLKAIAYKTGWSNSEIASATYTVNLATFASGTSFTTGLNPEGISAGDLNGDGKVDLAVGLYNGKGVSFLLGNGNGGFAAKQDMANSPNSTGSFASILTASIAVGDINADNKADVFWGAWGDNFLSVLTNTTTTNASTLTWANNQPDGYNPGISGPRGVALTDVDADGLKDIVVGEANGNKLIVYLNQSGSLGTFVKFGTFWLFNPDSTVYNGNAHPWMIALADFNNDGKPDVVGGGGFAGIFSVLLNSTTAAGTPAFETANRINTNTALGCTENQSVSISDFNGDGKADIAATCTTSGADKVALFLNTTSANATAASFTVGSIDVGDALRAVTSGDVNGDGKADIVTIADTSPNTMNVYRGQGDGTFAAAESFTIGTGTGPGRVMLVDVNADSRLDAVVTHGSTNQITVFLNQTAN